MKTLPEIPEEVKITKKEKTTMNVTTAQEVQTDRVDEVEMKLRERIDLDLENPYQKGE